MAYTGSGSGIGDLINPEILGAYIDVKMMDAIKLTPFMEVDRTLEGRSGDTLTLPVYSYIGAAVDVTEGEDIVLRKIEADTVDVKIKKVATGIELTDEAILIHHGDIVNEAGKQLLMSIADKVEEDCFATLRAGAALIIAGIAANGKTEIYNLNHIDRGYENIEEKFRNLGAKIERVKE